VLALSVLFEGGSWWIARKEFRKTKGALGYIEAVRLSKDPTVFSVLFEDSAALLGLGIAFAGILGAQLLDMPELDGAASIGIALVLAATAMFLARESKGLLIGEAALPGVQDAILAIAQQDRAVQKANGVLTIHMGPREIVAALSVEFEDELAAPEIEECVQRLEDRLKKEVPEVIALFVKPQTKGTWETRRKRVAEASDQAQPSGWLR
jgi:divalent metal cation (Fe/Co/Zn/Cd) transporter